MTLQTCAICLRDGEPQRVTNVFGISGFGVHAAHAVAGLAGLFLEPALLIGFNQIVGVLGESVKDFFVAALANHAAHIFRFRLGRRFLGA